jgi:TonB family protein
MVKALILLCILAFPQTAFAQVMPKVFGILSIPASAGEPQAKKAVVEYVSDGFFLKSCRVIKSSGDVEADKTGCRTVSFRASGNPVVAETNVWSTITFNGQYLPPTIKNPLSKSRLALDYPVDALLTKKQGSVVVRVDLDSLGVVSACHVVSSSDVVSLDKVALKSVCKKNKYFPATLNGEPVASINMQLTMFSLGK